MVKIINFFVLRSELFVCMSNVTNVTVSLSYQVTFSPAYGFVKYCKKVHRVIKFNQNSCLKHCYKCKTKKKCQK